jgi:hypothetical protein
MIENANSNELFGFNSYFEQLTPNSEYSLSVVCIYYQQTTYCFDWLNIQSNNSEKIFLRLKNFLESKSFMKVGHSTEFMEQKFGSIYNIKLSCINDLNVSKFYFIVGRS